MQKKIRCHGCKEDFDEEVWEQTGEWIDGKYYCGNCAIDAIKENEESWRQQREFERKLRDYR